MTSRPTSVALIVAATLVLGVAAFAQEGAGQQRGREGQAQGGQAQADIERQINELFAQIAQDPETAADKLFLLTTVLDNRAEIELARRVQEKAKNDQVKRLAQRMAQQLEQENQELQRTAQALGMRIPEGIQQAAVQEVRIVAALPADQLDKQYTAHVQAENAGDVAAYQSAAEIANNPQVKQLAQQQLRAQQQRSGEWNQSAQAQGMPSGSEARPAGGTIRGPGGEDRR